MDHATAPTTGAWLDPLAYFPLAVSIEGAWTGTVFIIASNSEAAPPSGEDRTHFPILGDPGGVTGPLMITIDQPVKWLCAWSPDLASAAGVTVAFVSARPPVGQRTF